MPTWPYVRTRLAILVILGAALLWLQPGLALDQQRRTSLPAATSIDQAAGAICECEGCTSVLVGKTASVDGATMTSHSCDSTTDRTWMDIVPSQTHKPGEMTTLWMDPKESKGPNDPDRVPAGEIPQAPQTYTFLNAAYPVMNEHQLAIGETTFGGKRELKSDVGIIDCPEL